MTLLQKAVMKSIHKGARRQLLTSVQLFTEQQREGNEANSPINKAFLFKCFRTYQSAGNWPRSAKLSISGSTSFRGTIWWKERGVEEIIR
ncbi:hypothetical protein AVEN_12440-1 [Araneus ventricosus]|uniref:Uncharacterized protein n=1 Tax=Araneus ventricosus TaxID=182803 RepID=A0A4Y2HUT9_ARAVE|nr:hypothetical protein AVEN_12440-1 [Araneus ventricosus]